MTNASFDLTVVGGGLAGSEAAWQAATRGLKVRLYEMRPKVMTGAHTTEYLAELVCSNSLGSNLPDRAPGLLKEELRRLDSLLIKCAEQAAVPAGGALAVDRGAFSELVTQEISRHENIEVVREEVQSIPTGLTIIASGPLTSDALSKALVGISGEEHLYFFDAIAPIVSLDTVNMGRAFRASRYGRGVQEDGDYINCPMTQDEYENFVSTLASAERTELRDFEIDLEKGVRAGRRKYFEGCLPVEVLAGRGLDSLAYGPLRPVGLNDPRSGRRPHAVVQLRQDNLAGTMFNMVGFQTNLTFPDQLRVFRMIPGLEQAEFLRYGQMHRNTFIYSPGLLLPSLQFKERDNLLFAGQITGIEGYVGNIASGFLAGVNASEIHAGREPVIFPKTTMLGALCHYITSASERDFQPMKANYGIVPPLEDGIKRSKRERAAEYSRRALHDLEIVIEDEKTL